MKMQWLTKTKKVYYYLLPILNSDYQPYYVAREFDYAHKKFVNEWNVLSENDMILRYGIRTVNHRKPMRRRFHAVDNNLLLVDRRMR